MLPRCFAAIFTRRLTPSPFADADALRLRYAIIDALPYALSLIAIYFHY